METAGKSDKIYNEYLTKTVTEGLPMIKHKVLIAKDHSAFCHDLADYLGEMSIFEIMPFAYDGYQTIQRIAVEKPDILLLDAVLPNMDGISVLKKLNAMGLSEGIRIIVMAPFNNEEMIDKLTRLGALYVIQLPAVPSMVFSRIVDFAIDDNITLREAEERKEESRTELRDTVISNYLNAIRAPINLLGYKLARAAVTYCVDNYDRQPYITKEVYPYVAELFNATPKQVERNIRTLIEATWQRGNMENINKLFGYSVSQHKGRPTNKEFIALLTERSVMRIRQR